jgi:6,7-dimethyl-8-ribityllumazine synthase
MYPVERLPQSGMIVLNALLSWSSLGAKPIHHPLVAQAALLTDSLRLDMSEASPSRPAQSRRRFRFAIVASEFNGRYVDALIDHARAEFSSVAPNASISIHRVPGSFEIPVLVRKLADQNQTDAIIAMGVILKGETEHAANLAASVTNALQQIAIDQGVPIINAVLSLNDSGQADKRCFGDKINRGTEAARAAVAISESMSSLKGSELRHG